VAAAPGDITEFPLPTAESLPEEITAGPDGNLWFTDFRNGRIGRITAGGTITEYATGISGHEPYAITAGPDGNMWFTEPYGGRIGRITPTGTITEFANAGGKPLGITAGPDGNLWYTQQFGNQIGRITPTGTVTLFATGIAGINESSGITAGPDGNVWFTEGIDDRIGRITPAGTITEYAIGITTDSYPFDITAGPDGNLWFTEGGGDRIGRITPTGTITEYATGITTGSYPAGVTAGRDGNLWFTEFDGNRIGRVEVARPQATLSPASHDFGEQALGSAGGPQQFTLTNTGTTRLTVGDVSISGADPGDFAISDDRCSGAAIRPGLHNTCTIGVTFTPTAAGARSATLTIPDNAAGSPHTAALTGVSARAASAVQLTSTPNPSTFGDPVTFTAHVSTTAPVAPTGSVTFTDGATSLGAAVVDGTGTATLTTTTLHGGQRAITATYSGDANLLSSSTTTGQQVNAAPSTLTARPAQLVVQLPGTSGLRLSARLAVTSTDAPIAGQPVAMRVNGTTACTATTSTDGVATCTAPLIYLLGVTLHGYTATYPGSPDYQPATGHAGLLG